jgi:tetratricopeptide (TPR) repeat protein
MEEEIQKAETSAKKAWPFIMSWVGGITALIGLLASVAGGITWFQNHHKQQAELQAKMALAQAQAKQGEYQASIQSYADILKADPLYRPALDQQLNTAMLWVEDFDVSAQSDQNAAELAAPALDQIMAILDSALNRSKGSQAADVQAHIGWAHWLNQHIAEREFGPVAEQDLRAALAVDPSNVYANGMLGNWMLRNGKNFTEAMQHINIAVSTGKVRPFIRKLQLGGLIYLDEKGARAEVVKAASDMRKSGESLDEGPKTRILSFCFDPIVTDHGELTESLSAVPPDEAWATYLWIDDQPGDAQVQRTAHDFIKANLLELSGKRQESLRQYRLLQKELENGPGTMENSVESAITRLSHS